MDIFLFWYITFSGSTRRSFFTLILVFITPDWTNTIPDGSGSPARIPFLFIPAITTLSPRLKGLGGTYSFCSEAITGFAVSNILFIADLFFDRAFTASCEKSDLSFCFLISLSSSISESACIRQLSTIRIACTRAFAISSSLRLLRSSSSFSSSASFCSCSALRRDISLSLFSSSILSASSFAMTSSKRWFSVETSLFASSIILSGIPSLDEIEKALDFPGEPIISL